jgi:hypothetical protein
MCSMLIPDSARMRVTLLMMPTRSSPASSSWMPALAGRRRGGIAPRDDELQPRRLEAAQRRRERLGVLGRHLEVHHAGELAGQARHAARRPVRAVALRPVGQQADDAGTIGAHHGDDQRRRARRRILGQHDGAPDHRRARREADVLRLGRQLAVVARMADDAAEQRQAHRRQLALPQLARRLAARDEAPVLRGDRSGVPAVGEVVDRTAGDRVALEDRSTRPRRCRGGAAGSEGW